MTNVVAIDGGFKRDSELGISCMYMTKFSTPGDWFKVSVEKSSTVQRAEINGLILALNYAVETGESLTIISDSSYVTNTVQKEWYKNWENKGWVTASDEPVKNADLWQIASKLLEEADVTVLHINSHVLSIGKVVAATLIAEEKYNLIRDILVGKYETPNYTVLTRIEAAKESFKLMNGIEAPEESLKEMIILNTIVDTLVDYVKNNLV